MKLTVLGCYGPYAPAAGACSGYLLQNDGFNLMLDCGHGAFAYLQKYINFRELHALVISHFHPDHYADIYAVRHALVGAFQDGSRKDPLVVYMPLEPKSIFDEISSWRDVFITIPLEDAMLRRNKFGTLIVDFSQLTILCHVLGYQLFPVPINLPIPLIPHGHRILLNNVQTAPLF